MRILAHVVVVLLGLPWNVSAGDGSDDQSPVECPAKLHAAQVLMRIDAPGENPTPRQVRTQEALIRSTSVLDRVIDDEQLRWTRHATTREETARELADSLHVAPYRETELVTIEMRRPTAEEAISLANAVADAFVEWRRDEERGRLQRAAALLREELQRQQQKLNAAQQVVDKLIDELGADTLTHTVRLDDRLLAQLEADYTAAEEAVAVCESRLREIKDLEGPAFLTAVAVVVPEVKQFGLLARLAEAETDLRSLPAYDDSHAAVESKAQHLREGVDETSAALKKGLRADCAVAKARLGSLEAELKKYREGFTPAFRKKHQALREAEREVEVEQTIFNALRTRLARESIALDSPHATVEIVERATHAVSVPLDLESSLSER